MRLYLVCARSRMAILGTLADGELGGRKVLAAMLGVEHEVTAEHPGVLLITHEGFAGRAFEQAPAENYHVKLLRPSRRDQAARHGEPLPEPVRRLIESANDSRKDQLDLEHHEAKTVQGVALRVASVAVTTCSTRSSRIECGR